MEYKKSNPILWIGRLILVVGGSLLLIYVIGFYIIFSFYHMPITATRRANEYLEESNRVNKRFRIESMDYSIYYEENTIKDTIYCQVHFYKKQDNIEANNIIFDYSDNKLNIESNGEIGNSTIDGLAKDEFKRSYLNVDCIAIKELRVDRASWSTVPNPFSSNSSFDMYIYYKALKDKITVDIPFINKSYSFEIEEIYNSYKESSKNKIENTFIVSLKKQDDNYLLCMMF